jgi:hypothetical protein
MRHPSPSVLGRFAVGAIVLFVCASCAAGATDGSVRSIGFYSGGSRCEGSDAATSFATGDSVRVAAMFSPELPTGSTVTITITKDGTAPQVEDPITLSSPQDCIYGTWPELGAGHYRVVVSTSADTGMPPLSGDFDVTP